jgi:hypothetical protein
MLKYYSVYLPEKPPIVKLFLDWILVASSAFC